MCSLGRLWGPGLLQRKGWSSCDCCSGFTCGLGTRFPCSLWQTHTSIFPGVARGGGYLCDCVWVPFPLLEGAVGTARGGEKRTRIRIRTAIRRTTSLFVTCPHMPNRCMYQQFLVTNKMCTLGFSSALISRPLPLPRTSTLNLRCNRIQIKDWWLARQKRLLTVCTT